MPEAEKNQETETRRKEVGEISEDTAKTVISGDKELGVSRVEAGDR